MKDVTVGSLMQLNIFKEHMSLVAGAEGIDRSVVFVAVQEAPDFCEWLDGGEFVLSTWFAFVRNKKEGIEAFEKMADKIAALAIKVPRFIQEIPREILELAEKKKVPVFAVRRAAKFREIIQAISVAINSYQSSVLYEARSFYDELSFIAVNNGSEQKMLEELARRIDIPCLIVETNLRDSISSDPTAPETKRVILEEFSAYMERRTEFPTLSFRIDTLHVFPCASKNSCYCYVVAIAEKQLSDKNLLMCNQLRTFLTIKRQERAEVRQKDIERLFFNFILSDNLQEDLAEQEFRRMGLDTSGAFQAAILTSDGSENSAKFSSFRFFAADFCRLLRSSVNRMEVDKMIFLIGHGARSRETILAENALTLLKKYPHQKLCLGPRVGELRNLPASYRFALRSLLLSPAAERFVDYPAYSHWLAILAGSGTNEAEALARRYIHPLLSPDKEESVTFSTLEAALFSNDIVSAAEKLGIHTNSIRYRLKRVRDLVGLDYFLPLDRSVLFIAYLMYKGGCALQKGNPERDLFA